MGAIFYLGVLRDVDGAMLLGAFDIWSQVGFAIGVIGAVVGSYLSQKKTKQAGD